MVTLMVVADYARAAEVKALEPSSVDGVAQGADLTLKQIRPRHVLLEGDGGAGPFVILHGGDHVLARVGGDLPGFHLHVMSG